MAVTRITTFSQLLDTAGTSITFTNAGGFANDDLLIVQISANQATAFNTPAGWTKIHDQSNSGTVIVGSATFWKIASGEGASWTFTWTGSGKGVAALNAYRDFDSANPIETSQVTVGAAGTAALTGVTVAAPDGYLYAAVAQNKGGTAGAWTPPAGMTERWDRNTATGSSHLSAGADAPITVGGATGTKTFTAGGAVNEWVGIVIAIAPISLTPSNTYYGDGTYGGYTYGVRGPSAQGVTLTVLQTTAVSIPRDIIATRSATSVTSASEREQTNKIVPTSTVGSTIASSRRTNANRLATATTNVSLLSAKAFGRIVSATVASAVTSLRAITTTKPTAVATTTASAVKRPNVALTSTQANTASLTKRAGVIRSATQITQVFFASARAYLTTQSASVATAVSARKAITATRSATLATTVASTRALSIIRSLVEATVASATKRATRTLASAQATAASETTRPNKLLAATQATSASLGPRAISRAITVVEATAVTLRKAIVRAIPAATQGTSASVNAIRAFLITLTASQPSQASARKQTWTTKFAQAQVLASAVRMPLKVASTTISLAASLLKRTAHAITATQATTATEAHQNVAIRAFNTTVATTASVAKRINMTQNVQVVSVVIKAARASRTIVATTSTAVSLVKQSRITKLASKATIASIITSGLRPLTIVAQVVTNAVASRRINHNEGVTLNTQTKIVKAITHEILASISATAKDTRKPVFGLTLSTVVNTVVSVLANFVSSGNLPDFKHHKSQGGMRGSVTHGREAGSRGKTGGGSGGHGGLGGVHGHSSTKQKRVVR